MPIDIRAVPLNSRGEVREANTDVSRMHNLPQNVFHGSCDGFVNYIDQTGAIDQSGAMHSGWGGYTSWRLSWNPTRTYSRSVTDVQGKLAGASDGHDRFSSSTTFGSFCKRVLADCSCPADFLRERGAVANHS